MSTTKYFEISSLMHELYKALKEQSNLPPVLEDGIIKVPGHGYLVEAKTSGGRTDTMDTGITFITDKGAELLGKWSNLMVRADYKQEGINLMTTDNVTEFIPITRWIAPNIIFDDQELQPQVMELQMTITDEAAPVYAASITRFDQDENSILRRDLRFYELQELHTKYIPKAEQENPPAEPRYAVTESEDIKFAITNEFTIDQILDLTNPNLPQVIRDSALIAMHTIVENVLNTDQTRSPR